KVRMFVIVTVQVGLAGSAPGGLQPGPQRTGSPATAGVATSVTGRSAGNAPWQFLSPNVRWSPEGSTSGAQSRPARLPSERFTCTVPSPLMPTSSWRGVNVPEIQSSASTVNVHGPDPLQLKRLQWTKLGPGVSRSGRATSGSGVATTVTFDPLATGTAHGTSLSRALVKS